MFVLISFSILLIQLVILFVHPILKITLEGMNAVMFMFGFYINFIILLILTILVYWGTLLPTQKKSFSKRIRPRSKQKRRSSPKPRGVTFKQKRNSSPKKMGATNYLHIADIAKKERDYERAIKMYNKALEAEPDNVSALNSLGVIYRNRDEYRNAIEVAKLATQVDPKNKFAWNLLGLIYKIIGDHDGAIDAYTHTRDLDSLNKQTWQNLALAYSEKGDYENAIEHMINGLEKEPKYSMMWYKLAKFYLAAGQIDEALNTCETSIQLDPENNSAKDFIKLIKTMKKKGKKPEPKQAPRIPPKKAPKEPPKSSEKSANWTEIGYEKFLTEAIEKYKEQGRIPIRGGNITIAFRKWYNKNYREL
jgi:tetratricopeptide (TPR) repeat protein